MNQETTPQDRFRSRLFDTGLVLVLAFGGLSEMFVRTSSELGGREADLAEAALTLGVVLPLLWRRRWPIQAMAVSGFFYFALVLSGYSTSSGVDSAQLVAIYSVGAYGVRPVAGVARWVAGAVIAGAVMWAHSLGYVTYPQFAVMMTTWTGAAVLGETVYVRRRYQIALEERARMAESERDERARLAVQDERARISRELHDVWAHTLSLVVVQAGAAQEVLDDSPELARESLVRIQQAGRQALAEIRRLISSDEAGAGFDRAPAPGIEGIGPLVDEFRESGLPVNLKLEGELADLPDDVGLSTYRIVQQALTNTLSHGGPGVSADVSVRMTSGNLVIHVADDGLGAAASVDPDRQGRGVIGMRERVAVFGGEFKAGPRAEGGFEVKAVIPIGANP